MVRRGDLCRPGFFLFLRPLGGAFHLGMDEFIKFKQIILVWSILYCAKYTRFMLSECEKSHVFHKFHEVF
jgi:hypothetical protein